jgi:hypothetical protein
MSTAGAWTAEFETSGRVVFPQRRNRLLIRLAFGLLLMGGSISTIVDHVRDDDMGGALGVLRLTALAGFVIVVVWSGWQLVTLRPVVTVDRDGIRLGRRAKEVLRWSQIGSIGDPTGLAIVRTIAIQPTDTWATKLTIGKDNVLELAEFSQWLRSVHEQQRDD